MSCYLEPEGRRVVPWLHRWSLLACLFMFSQGRTALAQDQEHASEDLDAAGEVEETPIEAAPPSAVETSDKGGGSAVPAVQPGPEETEPAAQVIEPRSTAAQPGSEESTEQPSAPEAPVPTQVVNEEVTSQVSTVSAGEVPGAEGGGSGEALVEASPSPSPEPLPSLREGLTIVPRLGLIAGGWSRFEVDCDTAGSLDCGDEEFDDLNSAAALQIGLEALYQPNAHYRLGLGVNWLPSVRASGGGSLRTLGSDLSALGILEGVADVSGSIALTGRLEGGVAFVFPQGALNDYVDQSEDDCAEVAAQGIQCTVDGGVRPAASYGAAVGLLWQLTDARLRLDVSYRMQTVTVLKQEASTNTGAIDARLLMHQNRVALMAGAEF